MDLIFWRHAEAEDAGPGQDDLERSLTHRGEKQAARMAAWLDRQLPEGTKILSSPARRCEQTVMALGRKYKTRAELAPDTSVEDLLALVRWPDGKGAVVVVGHQPTLGQAIARIMGLKAGECSVKKGAIWWLRARGNRPDGEEGGSRDAMLVTAQSPETL